MCKETGLRTSGVEERRRDKSVRNQGVERELRLDEESRKLN